MKKYFFIVLIFAFSMFSFSASNKEKVKLLAVASEDSNYMMTATTVSGMSMVMIKWIKPDSLKDGKGKALVYNEKGDSKEIKADFTIMNGTKSLTFSAITGDGDLMKKFMKNSEEISITFQDKKGNKSEEIKFKVAKLNEDWK